MAVQSLMDGEMIMLPRLPNVFLFPIKTAFVFPGLSFTWMLL